MYMRAGQVFLIWKHVAIAMQMSDPNCNLERRIPDSAPWTGCRCAEWRAGLGLRGYPISENAKPAAEPRSLGPSESNVRCSYVKKLWIFCLFLGPSRAGSQSQSTEVLRLASPQLPLATAARTMMGCELVPGRPMKLLSCVGRPLSSCPARNEFSSRAGHRGPRHNAVGPHLPDTRTQRGRTSPS